VREKTKILTSEIDCILPQVCHLKMNKRRCCANTILCLVKLWRRLLTALISYGDEKLKKWQETMLMKIEFFLKRMVE